MDYDQSMLAGANYDDLPPDPEDCFVALESICRKNLARMISNCRNDDFNILSSYDAPIEALYMVTVHALAEEYGIKDFIDQNLNVSSCEYFAEFSLAVCRVTARIAARQGSRRRKLSVKLLPNTRIKIDYHISLLRDSIATSNLTDARKGTLLSKLTELSAALDEPRLSFGKVFQVLMVIAGAVASLPTLTTEGKDVVSSIMRLIDHDHRTENAAMVRLGEPQRQLPAPTSLPHDLDDELPF